MWLASMHGGLFEMRSASGRCQGRGHKAQGVLCQDFVAHRIQGGRGAVVLADGAGSARYADLGAKMAVESVLKAMMLFDRQELFSISDTRLAETLVSTVMRTLQKHHRPQSLPMDYASTLLMVVAEQDQMIAAHVGDGVIALKNNAGTKVISHPERGEYANTTYFMTHKDVLEHVRIYRGSWSSGDVAMLMSDGTAESLYEVRSKNMALATDRLLDYCRDTEHGQLQKDLQRELRNSVCSWTQDDCSWGFLINA